MASHPTCYSQSLIANCHFSVRDGGFEECDSDNEKNYGEDGEDELPVEDVTADDGLRRINRIDEAGGMLADGKIVNGLPFDIVSEIAGEAGHEEVVSVASITVSIDFV